MKAFKLRMLLSRIDPNAEVLVTTADPSGHGFFANPICGVGQDRTVIVPSAADGTRSESPVLVLHYHASDRVWAAKGPLGWRSRPPPKCCKHGTLIGQRCWDCEDEVK